MKKTFLLLAVLAVTALVAVAGDSPQFGGPNRDGVFPEQGLLKTWPENGPPVAWVAKGLGKGYGSISVANGMIYVAGMLEDQNGFIFVLNSDGKVGRKIAYGKETTNDQAPGPRSTPTIEGNRLYLMSGLGVVYCIDLAKDAVAWQVNAKEKFQGQKVEWEYAESVLVDGNNVICTPGGPDAAVVALNKATGDTVWATKGFGDAASYCSPIIVDHKGHRILLTETAKFVIGVNPDTGALLWKYDHPTKYDIHGVTPIYSNGLVYFSGGYGSGGGALELSPDGSAVTLKWENKDLDCQHHGVVLLDGYLYGTGHNKSELMCLEMATGKAMWDTKEVKQGDVVAADGMLYVYEGPKSGIVDLVRASSAGFERTGKFLVTEGTDKHWAHPVVANGRLYIRHGEALIAYNISAK